MGEQGAKYNPFEGMENAFGAIQGADVVGTFTNAGKVLADLNVAYKSYTDGGDDQAKAAAIDQYQKLITAATAEEGPWGLFMRLIADIDSLMKPSTPVSMAVARGSEGPVEGPTSAP